MKTVRIEKSGGGFTVSIRGDSDNDKYYSEFYSYESKYSVVTTKGRIDINYGDELYIKNKHLTKKKNEGLLQRQENTTGVGT